MIAGYTFDFFAKLTGNKFLVSSVRVKFCAPQFNSVKAHKFFKLSQVSKKDLKKLWNMNSLIQTRMMYYFTVSK